jgi:predicted N-acetyltransferase YhbS
VHGTVTIRKAVAADTPAILACLRAAFEPYRRSYTPAGFTDTVLTPKTIQQRLNSMWVLVAVAESGKVVGTIACSVVGGNEGHLRGMAVCLNGRAAALPND